MIKSSKLPQIGCIVRHMSSPVEKLLLFIGNRGSQVRTFPISVVLPASMAFSHPKFDSDIFS
jgi:hypothetical protein